MDDFFPKVAIETIGEPELDVVRPSKAAKADMTPSPCVVDDDDELVDAEVVTLADVGEDDNADSDAADDLDLNSAAEGSEPLGPAPTGEEREP